MRQSLATGKGLCYRQLERCFMADNTGARVSYFIVGLGIGTLLGMLFAPKSGEEMREFLLDRADESREYAQRKARDLRERAEELLERSREMMARQKDSISAAVEAGKDAYQREKAKAQ
jgi:gas vesicle protein